MAMEGSSPSTLHQQMKFVWKEDWMKMKKIDDQALARPIPHQYQSFPIWEYSDRDGLGERIWGLFKDIDAIIEYEVELACIRDADLGEHLKNWTSTQILIPWSSW